MASQLRWWIGGRESRDGLHTLNRVREVSEAEAERLRARFMFVVNLASQDTFAAACASATRCLELLARVRSDMRDRGSPSRQREKAIIDEIATLGHLALRLEEELRSEIEAEDFDPLDIHRFNEVRHRMRAAGAYLGITHLASSDRTDDVAVTHRENEVYFVGLPSSPATDVVTGLVGTLSWIVQAHQLVVRTKFDEIAAEIDSLTNEVEKGQPSLIGLRIDPKSADWSAPTLIDIPDFEVACLREELRRTGPPTAEEPSLLAARTRTYLEFGDVDSGFAVVGATSGDGINTLPSAEFKLDAKALGHQPIDYWAPVSYALQRRGPKFERFAGSVQEAKVVDDDVIALEGEGALDLIEHGRGGTLAAGMSDAELIRAMLIHAGLREDLFPIDGPVEERPEEQFEVFVPVRGLEAQADHRVAEILLVPFERGQEVVANVERPIRDRVSAKLIAEFEDADSYALALVTASMPGEAEDLGLAAIETAIAWLVTRQRYGTALLPDNTAQAFIREAALRPPETGPVVYVRGTRSRRRWMRWPNGAPTPESQKLDASSSLLDPKPRADIGVHEQQALLALRRAATDADPLSRIQSLWQAIEGYAARTKREEKLFPPARRKEVIDAAPSDLSREQRRVLIDSINKLNQPVLADRLRWRLERDGVPVTEGELELLDELREVRNDVVHGRGAEEIPSTEKINHGIGIVARMLVHRLSAVGPAAG
jgi:hypothetical protein